MTHDYKTVIAGLRASYDRGAAERDERSEKKDEWKVAEREAFLERLQEEGHRRLLEIGAGTGQDSLFFQWNGLEMVATDLSPEMVRRCREKGLTAHEMDFLSLDFPPDSFDAVYALNTLLHVPNASLPAVMGVIYEMLVPSGLFFIGVYGGAASEGVAEEDWHEPPRFFSFRTDEQLQALARECFEIVDFHVLNEGTKRRFQSLTVRKGKQG